MVVAMCNCVCMCVSSLLCIHVCTCVHVIVVCCCIGFVVHIYLVQCGRPSAGVKSFNQSTNKSCFLCTRVDKYWHI